MDFYELKEGDIIFYPDSFESLYSSRNMHTAVVIEKKGLSASVLDLSEKGLFWLTARRLPDGKEAAVFRLYSYDEPDGMFAHISSNWVMGMRQSSSFNSFSRISMVTNHLKSSFYGSKAREYTNYLFKECREQPPKELLAGYFSGVICSYVPIALYQAVYGFRCVEIMALDALTTTPHTLVNYLDRNPLWRVERLMDNIGVETASFSF